MARARNIKPGFFDNEILGELPALTRLLFIGLWCLADREGRLQDRPKRIKKELLGYDDVTADDVDTMLQQLNDNGFIQRYEIAGEQYIQVTNFLKHQNPHCKEQASVIPAPDGEDMGLGVVAEIHVKGRTGTAGNSQDLRTYQTEKEQENTKTPDMHSASTVQAQEKHRSCPADSLIPDSLIPDSKDHTVVAEQPTAPEPEGIDGEEETKSGKRQQRHRWKRAFACFGTLFRQYAREQNLHVGGSGKQSSQTRPWPRIYCTLLRCASRAATGNAGMCLCR